MKIDIFTHFLPKKYYELLQKKMTLDPHDHSYVANKGLYDLDIRFRAMDRAGDDLLHAVTLVTPLPDRIGNLQDQIDLCRLANEELAELVVKYPDRFVAAAATLPLSDMDAALEELDRAIRQLKMKGVQITSNINGEPLDSPRLRPLYQKMAEYDLPIWIHPWDQWMSDEKEKWAKRGIGWPFETTLAMSRLALSGIFQEFPNIKFITHHAGGMAPFYASRIRINDLKYFYNDTALYGNTPALELAYKYFGSDRLLFGTDMPLGSTLDGSYGFTYDTIQAIERMDIPEEDKQKIFSGNARKILKLSL